MNKKLNTAEVRQFFNAIMSLKDIDEYYEFFEDICTVNEITSLAQRLEVARMLRQGKTYVDIAEKTGTSTATISRVNRQLNYGCGGLEMVIDRLKEEE